MPDDDEDQNTGWRQPEIVPSSTGGMGIIKMATGLEKKPCCTCKHWHKDTRKLEQFLRSRKLTPDAEGRYEVRIPELPERRSMKVDLKDWGFCLTLAIPTHMNAGARCPHWKPTVTRQDLEGKIR